MRIYTDGSAHPNPGPGGFGVVICDDYDNIISYYSEQFENVTNNQMELSAILYAMKKHGVIFNQNTFVIGGIVEVYTDSAYALNVFTKWMFTWADNGWRRPGNKEIENLDIIKQYYDIYMKGYRIELKLIKGHSGNKFNELADKLATGKICDLIKNIV